MFNKCFKDFDGVQPSDQVQYNDPVTKYFRFSSTIPIWIEDIIKKCAVRPASDQDGVARFIVSAVANFIGTSLCYLINESFSSGQYLEVLEVSESIPVYTNQESSDDISNYRKIFVIHGVLVDISFFVGIVSMGDE